MTISIEVAFADENTQLIVAVSVPDVCCVEEAIQRSGILASLPGVNEVKNKVGIFGTICPLSTLVQPGDRVEIYRALCVDPKQNRRRRARQQKSSATEQVSQAVFLRERKRL